MENKKFFEIHRSEAIQILLAKDLFPSLYTNLKLAEELENSFPEKQRMYLVKEDHLPLAEDFLTAKTF